MFQGPGDGNNNFADDGHDDILAIAMVMCVAPLNAELVAGGGGQNAFTSI